MAATTTTTTATTRRRLSWQCCVPIFVENIFVSFCVSKTLEVLKKEE